MFNMLIISVYKLVSCVFLLRKTEGRHASAKAHVVDHLASFMSSREEISRPGIDLGSYVQIVFIVGKNI